MSTEFISILAPPGDTIASYDRKAPPDTQPDSVPSTFLEAMSIRKEVFCDEQGVPLENELDADDPRCWHWVAYASVGNTLDGGRGRDGMASRVPVGTIRLVPPPHPPHPAPDSHHAIDHTEGDTGAVRHEEQEDEEPYIKLGRLAILSPYRKLGLSRLLVSAALSWASKNPELILPPLEPTEAEAIAQRENGKEPPVWKGRVLVHAQESVQGLWQKLGFVKDEGMGTWDEEGIMHVGMWRVLSIEEKPGLFMKAA